jgi:O-antigen/teichoic acid export membrane protein
MSIKGVFYKWCSPPLRATWDRIEASDIGYRLARGAFWSLCGVVASRALTLLASIFVARMLGREGFGELGIIRSTVEMFGVFAGFGLGLTATKHVAEFRRTDPDRAGRIIVLSGMVAVATATLAGALLFVLAPWLAAQTLAAPHLGGLIRVGCVVLVLSALNGAQTGALAGFEAFKTVAWVNLWAGLTSFPILVAGTYFGGLEGAVWALAASLAINWVLNHFALRREAASAGIPLRFLRWPRDLGVLWRFSLPAVFAAAMVGPVNWACSAMLVNQPGGYGEMGVFNAANQWFLGVMFLPSVLGQVVLPVLSERYGANDQVRSAKVLKVAIGANALAVVPLVIGLSLLSPFVMDLYGTAFRDGWPTLVAVLVTAGVMAIQAPVGQVLAASGRMWLGFLMNLGWAAAFVGLTALLVSHGSVGVAAGRLGAYILHTTWVFAFAYYLLRRRSSGRA